MRSLLLSTAVLAFGCAARFVPVRIDDPAGARVTIEGATTAEGVTPLVARLEAGNAWCSGFPVVIDLPDASRYGRAGALRLYGRVNVGRLPWHTRDLPLRVSPDEAQLRSLVGGEIDRVYVATCGAGPCASPACDQGCGHKRRPVRATLELRLTPF